MYCISFIDKASADGLTGFITTTEENLVMNGEELKDLSYFLLSIMATENGFIESFGQK